MRIEEIPTPYYIVYEERMRRNLELITRVEREAGVNIIMAFKANALWRSFDVVREYNRDFTASSLNELRLGNEERGGSCVLPGIHSCYHWRIPVKSHSSDIQFS